jgi:predicted ATP-binding protein involved in virulence
MIRVDELVLTNFRGAGNLSLQLSPEQTSVFVGANGAGKTTVLDGAAILLSRLVGRIRSGSSGGRQFASTDISNWATETSNRIAVRSNNRTFEWSVSRVRAGRMHITSSNLHDATELASQFREHLLVDQTASLPLIVYYPVNRAVLDIPLRIRTKHHFEDQLAAYDDSLTGASSSFRVFFEWFRFREDLENELRLDRANFRDPQLQAVRRAIEALMPGFGDLRIRRSPLRMVVTKSGEEVTINQLSDGEKCLLALVGDLARRLALANPKQPEPLHGNGIVLIDELELHLHPVWQRSVVPALESTFPACQFIVSTHSAPILGHIHPGSVFLLSRTERDMFVRQMTTYGQDTDRILEEVFGSTARPVHFEEQLRTLFQNIDRNDLARARTSVEHLSGVLGNDDPDLVRAGVLLHRKEVLRK